MKKSYSRLFKDWTRFEKILLFGSIIILSSVQLIFRTDFLVTITSFVGICTALFLAKGKVLGQFLGLITVLLYSYVSFQNYYFGEVLIYVFLMLPLYTIGIISWLKNRNEKTKVVIPNKLAKNEWIIIILISIVLIIGFYQLLKFLNTEQLTLSTLSIIGNLYAIYLLVRRSRIGFLFYIFDDIILIILWMIPVLNGNLSVLPMVFNPLINFANDLYGWFNWAKLEKQELGEKNEC